MAVLKRLALVAALVVPINQAIADDDIAPGYWPWDVDAKEALEPPPEFKPYKLPTLTDDGLDYNSRPAALVKAPAINADAVLASVLSCYPAKSHWDIDVELRGQLRSNQGFTVDDDGGTQLGSNYVALITKIPLYSGRELDRQREREYRRRGDIAGLVADFVTSIASRNHAIRELALYRSLEARAYIRVQQGIVSASEQVTYLEKVADSQKNLIKTEARIMESRLRMTSTCESEKHLAMNNYLKHVSAIPTKTK